MWSVHVLCKHWKCYSCDCHSEGCWPPLISQRHIWRPRLTPTKCSSDCSTSTANVSQESSMLGYNHTSLTWHIMTPPSARPATPLRYALAQVAKQQAYRSPSESNMRESSTQWQWQTWKATEVTRCPFAEKRKSPSSSAYPGHTSRFRSSFPSIVSSCLRSQHSGIKLRCSLGFELTDERQD